MGKHEREQIKEAEEIIVKILNNQDLNSAEKNNHWFRHAVAIAEQIKKDFRYQKAIHLGNRYDNTGDLLLVSDRKEIFIEIKMSETKTGIGTMANISQNALTENHLFRNGVKSWSEFRREAGHDEWVSKSLNTFARYSRNILAITNPVIQKEEKARYLRSLKENGNKKASEILNSIHERDKDEKIKYLSYLSSQDQRGEIIKRFFILITLGVHQEEELRTLINNDNFFREIQNLFVYYSNLSGGNIIVRKEDIGEKTKKILAELSDFKIIFLKGSTNCKVIGMKGTSPVPLLQIAFHWKNIAQGIKTPCLNIFDLTKSSLD